MDRWPSGIAFAILIGSLAFAASPSTASGPLWLQGEMAADSWVAIRFDLTPDNDLVARIGRVFVDHGVASRYSAGTYVIIDGVPDLGAWLPGGLAPFPPAEKEIAYLAVEDVRLGLLDGGSAEGRSNIPVGYNGWPHANHSVTLVGIIRGGSGYYTVNATWTRGVTSHDITTGPAVVLYKDEWGSGAHVGTYGFQGSASASAAAQFHLTTTTDTLGWFLPGPDPAPGVGAGFVTRDGELYPGGDMAFGSTFIASKGPTDWGFHVNATVEGDNPRVAIGLAQLPGDDYLFSG